MKSNSNLPACSKCGCGHYYKTEASFDKRPRYVCAACGDTPGRAVVRVENTLAMRRGGFQSGTKNGNKGTHDE